MNLTPEDVPQYVIDALFAEYRDGAYAPHRKAASIILNAWIKGPPEPGIEVMAIRDKDGIFWERADNWEWVAPAFGQRTWGYLNAERAPLTLLTETPR